MPTIIPALALKYVPEGENSKRGYIEMVREQILGKNKNGEDRPNDDLLLFLKVAKNSGLDPFLHQIYAVYRWDTLLGREKMTIQTGIDGMRASALNTGLYAGSDDAIFEEKDGKIIKATVTVYKINKISGERMPTTASAYFEEYLPSEKNRKMWNKMPHTMIAKCAESLALRKAFPLLSQIYTEEEMQQANEELPKPQKNTIEGEKVDASKVDELANKILEEK
jgi:phage recombination protein Bet